MPFVRTKRIKGIEYRYLVESYREGNRVRQRVLVYLGEHKTVKAAYSHWQKVLKASEGAERKQARKMLSKLEPYR
jgi:hypothetical protein